MVNDKSLYQPRMNLVNNDSHQPKSNLVNDKDIYQPKSNLVNVNDSPQPWSNLPFSITTSQVSNYLHVYLPTLSVVRRIILNKWIIANGELRRMETTDFLALFKVQHRHLSGGTEENHEKIIIYNSLSVGRHLKSVLLSTKQKCYTSDRAVQPEMVLLNPFSSLGPVRYEKSCCTCKLSKFVGHFVTCYMASDKCKKCLTLREPLVCFYKHFLVFCCNSLRKQIFLSRSFSTSYVGKYHFF